MKPKLPGENKSISKNTNSLSASTGTFLLHHGEQMGVSIMILSRHSFCANAIISQLLEAFLKLVLEYYWLQMLECCSKLGE